MCDVCANTDRASRCPCCAEEPTESELVGFEVVEGVETLVDMEALRSELLCGGDSHTKDAFEEFLTDTENCFDDLEESNGLLHDFEAWL